MTAERTGRGRWLRWLGPAGLLVAGAVAWAVLGRSGQAPVAGVSRGSAREARGGGNGFVASTPPEVRLDALEAPPPAPAASARNPFRFQPVAAPGPTAVRPVPPPNVAALPGGASGTAEPGVRAAAPIALKFIGIIEAPGVGKVAALSDGRFVYHGREGDIIDGRYRIVKIGVESIVLEHVDGHGRQTIRLTG